MGNEIMPGRLSSAAAEKIEYDNWEDYEAASELWRRQHTARVVGYFACSPEQQAFDQCCTLPIPPIDTAPVLVLPLRFHLSRGPELGCALSERDCQEEILSTVNGLWEQAGVQWFLEGVVKEDWSAVRSAGVDLCAVRDQIWSLQRDPATGQMAGKEFRRKIFLEQLLLNHAQDMHTFDVYFFDLVGQQSQGCCISRETHTVIMGHRSTKGYAQPTPRPLLCLGKTCAHELGHALGLGHPAGQRFRDGTSCTRSTGRDNLMTGGRDSAGGGGTRLEDWQILIARRCAGEFLCLQEQQQQHQHHS